MKNFIAVIASIAFSNVTTLGQTSGYIEFSIGGPTDFIVTDSSGLRTGFDPRTETRYDEIPNVAYGMEAISSDVDSVEFSIIYNVFNFTNLVTNPAFQEKYSIEVIGNSSRGIFEGDFYITQTELDESTRIEIKGVIDSLQSVVYTLFYGTNPLVPPILSKFVDTTVVRQDLVNCYNLDLIRSDTLYENLTAKLHKIDSLLALGDTAKTLYEVVQFDDLLDDASGDTTKIMPDGYQILEEDVNLLVKSLNGWEGTITKPTTWANTVYVVRDVEVNTEVTLTVTPGARVKFFKNTSLSVIGTLVSDGSSGGITLSGAFPDSSWNGISVVNSCHATVTLVNTTIEDPTIALTLGEHANLTFDNCFITDAGIGLQIVPSLAECPIVPSPKYITNNTFKSVGIGIYLNTIAETYILNNTITGLWSPGSNPDVFWVGVHCIGSSPKMIGNHIDHFVYGLHFLSGSSPILEDGDQGGHNVVRNNYIGVKCVDGSDAVLGFLDDGEGGLNSIHLNESYHVMLENSVVFAQSNWWGTPQDPADSFSVDENSKLSYIPWLQEDPNGGSGPFSGNVNTKNSHSDLSSSEEFRDEDPIVTPIPLAMRQALTERSRGRYNEALNLLRVIISDPLLPTYARHWAIGQLLPVVERLPNPNFSEYLRTIELTHPTLVPSVRRVLPRIYLLERVPRNALAAYDVNIQRYPGSGLHRDALYGKFIVALYKNADTELAASLATALRNTFPSSTERYLSEIQLANYLGEETDAIQQMRSVKGKGGAATRTSNSPDVPEQFALGQNFPNPFNPVTIIRYQLPNDAYVHIVLYDILGRKVKTLVEGHRAAGYYGLTFDASTLATGVYFYRMIAGNYVAVRKLLVLK